MSTGGSAIRGSRVGAGPMGEQDRGFKAERITVSYYCSAGHEYSPQYAANVEAAEIPELIDCPSCGLPAGQDKANPPIVHKHEPYKTHLAYVKESAAAKAASKPAAKPDAKVAVVKPAKPAAKPAKNSVAKVSAKTSAKPATKAAAKPAKKK